MKITTGCSERSAAPPKTTNAPIAIIGAPICLPTGIISSFPLQSILCGKILINRFRGDISQTIIYWIIQFYLFFFFFLSNNHIILYEKFAKRKEI
jgi:hypothetical protein